MSQPNSKPWFIVAALSSFFGAIFAGFSTLDFVQHLDRQVHPLHCSFIPGVLTEGLADSGCRAVMNSAYSSFFRDTLWGGIPLSLLALAVFAYMVALVFDIGLSGRLEAKSDTAYLLLASALPLAMSMIYFGIAMVEVKALCKLCVGVYVSSSALTLSAFMLHRGARDRFEPKAKQRRALYFIEGLAFVVIAVVAYVALVPSYEARVQACGSLRKPDDKQHALLDVAKGKSGSVLEVIDPLCPACKQFERRMVNEQLTAGHDKQVLLFPLDSECNWMLKQSLHPGACMLSRALICAGKDYDAMFGFILDNQEDMRITATKEPESVRRQLLARFPTVSNCIDAAETKARLNNMLRYAAQNSLPIVTPQLYVSGQRLCDEDTDLGLNYALKILAKRH